MNNKNQVAQNIGSVIKKYRNKKNISQKALGEMIGVSHSTISRYERGLSDIPVSKLLEISEVCQFPLREYIWAFMTDDDAQIVLRRLMDKFGLDHRNTLDSTFEDKEMRFTTVMKHRDQAKTFLHKGFSSEFKTALLALDILTEYTDNTNYNGCFGRILLEMFGH